MGEASHPNRSEITIEATKLDKRLRRFGRTKSGYSRFIFGPVDFGLDESTPDSFGQVSTRASAIPWRNSEPDVFISQSCIFTGAYFAGDVRRSGAKIEQFV